MPADKTDHAADARAHELDRARERVGRVRAALVNRELAAVLGVVVFGVIWLANVDSPRAPARMRLARGDGDPLAQTTSFALAPDGTTIATVHQDGSVALRSANEEGRLRRVLGYDGSFRAVAFAPDGRLLALGGMKPGITLCRVDTTQAEAMLEIPIRETSSLAFSPDGRTLAATSLASDEIILWDMAAGCERMRLNGHASRVDSIAFSPDGRSLASGGNRDRWIIIWDLATGAQRRWPQPSASPISALAFSPDGSLLASASGFERAVRIWDPTSGVVRHLIRSCAPGKNSVAFAPDGHLLATADRDGSVKLWSMAAGRPLARLDGRSNWLGGVAFSPDGRTLAAIGNDTDVRLWDVAEIIGSRIDPRAN
jgi:WD40 repeat protein